MWEASREEILNKGKDRRMYIMSVGVVVALGELVRSPLSVGIALHRGSPALPLYLIRSSQTEPALHLSSQKHPQSASHDSDYVKCHTV